MKRRRTFGNIACVAVLLVSCTMREDIESARVAMEDFHRDVRERALNRICANAVTELKDAIGADRCVQVLNEITDKLGSPGPTRIVRVQTNHMAKGRYLIAEAATHFGRNEVRERFVWRIVGGSAHLAAYGLVSRDWKSTLP